jgi:hypothetical protein
MEFVIVEYPQTRRVRMDGSVFGSTQTVLPCRAGQHTFDLGSPQDYSPLTQTVRVSSTAVTMPMRIRFQPLTAAFVNLGAASAAAAAPPASTARRARKKRTTRKPGRARTRSKHR